MKKRIPWIFVLLLVVLTGVVTFQITRNTMREKQSTKSDLSEDALFCDVLDKNVKDLLPDGVDEEKLKAGIASGYLEAAGDEYGRYYTKEELDARKADAEKAKAECYIVEERLEGEYGGKTAAVALGTADIENPTGIATWIAEAKEKGAGRLVIDLRGFSGGSQSSYVELCKSFFAADVRLAVAQATKDGAKTDIVSKEGTALPLPVSVLVDSETSGFGELLAAGLRENYGAEIFGVKTAGRAALQSLIMLPDGDAVGVTSVRYLSGEGKEICGVGIEPDTVVTSENEKDDLALKAAAGYVIVD